jgi:hypothetical protein
MEVGNRVINIETGEIGYIEEIEGEYVTFRHLTPKNVPSCCSSVTNIKNLIIVPKTVVPMPRSKKWYEESKIFCDRVAGTLEYEGFLSEKE